MSVSIPTPPRPTVIYPDEDGNPIAENALQFEWIVTIKGGVDTIFRDRPDVFVAGDLLWYPVEGDPKTRVAPDTMVAFGRPKGYRGSYKQWEEGGIPPQVVFEVLSPGNRVDEMLGKFRFYEKFGVEEYYVFDPDDINLSGWIRRGEALERIAEMNGWRSPRLGVRFHLTGEDLTILGPDGRRFLTYDELAQERDQAQQQRDQAQQQRDREKEQRVLFEQQLDLVKQERARADEQRAEALRRAEVLAAKLRALGVDTETSSGS
jgi:Uma2 family endonuclease